MVVYLGYTLQMKMLFRGWPIMVHDMHKRRRSISDIIYIDAYFLLWTHVQRTILYCITALCHLLDPSIRQRVTFQMTMFTLVHSQLDCGNSAVAGSLFHHI